MKNETDCKCDFCELYLKYKWSVVSECKCDCHDIGFTGHDRLCCELPNVLKSDNPLTGLKSAKEYDDEIKNYFTIED